MRGLSVAMSGSVEIVRAERWRDARGWFVETYSEPKFHGRGIDCRFVQDNHSFSAAAFTLRGLHFQVPPCAQDKLVGCVRGRVFDVAVDVRRGSPTFGDWVGAELSAEGGDQMFIPVGFAHGFLTLEPNCEVAYKCSNSYSMAHESGLRWDDPDIAIDWPLPPDRAPELSLKDRNQPLLAQFRGQFDYHGRPLAALK